MNESKATISTADLEPDSTNAPVGKKKAQGLDTSCRIHIHSRRYRLADPDGVSGKAAIDGLVLAGILADDSPKQVKEVSYSQEKIPKTEIEETIIEIMEVL